MKRRRLFIAVRMLVLVGLVYFVWSWFFVGSSVQKTLHSAIRNAEKVIVVVHSSPWDNPPTDGDLLKNYKEEIYQTVELGPEQREALLRALPIAKDNSDHSAKACIFVPHHRVEIVKWSGSKLAWEICFKCGEHSVAGDHKRLMPEGWPASLMSFFQSQNIRTEVPQPRLEAGGGGHPAPLHRVRREVGKVEDGQGEGARESP